jgi:hypothetical protein
MTTIWTLVTAAECQTRAAEFVRDKLAVALCDAPDGGLALMREVVAYVFSDAAYHGDAADIPITDELLEIARHEIEDRP